MRNMKPNHIKEGFTAVRSSSCFIIVGARKKSRKRTIWNSAQLFKIADMNEIMINEALFRNRF